MRVIKNIVSQLHVFVLWALLSAVVWGWVFSAFITDAPAKEKVVIYVDGEILLERELDLRLEEDLPPGIRMIRAHPFSYVMFDDAALKDADLFIVPASRAGEYADSFLELPEDLTLGGRAPAEAALGVWGYPLSGAAGEYIRYSPAEEYYLFIGANSLHAVSLTGEGDDGALHTAQTLLRIREDRK